MEEMLKKIYDVMNDEGFLILEAGLSDMEEGKYYIEKKKRPIGDSPSYPNKYTIRKLLENALDSLAYDPYRGKQLRGRLQGYWSLRAGVYRMIYVIRNKEITVVVLRIQHRKEIYKKFRG